MEGFKIAMAVKPLKNVIFKDLHTTIAKHLVNYILSQDEKLLELHNKNVFKGYSFKFLEPIENRGIYSKNKIYAFEMRFADKTTTEQFYNTLQRIESTPAFEIIGVRASVISYDWFLQAIMFNSVLCSITPAAVTVNSHTKPTLMWTKDMSDIDFLKNALENNLSAKLRKVFGIKNDDEFIDDIEVISKQPIVTNYANKTKIVGNKFKITIKPNKQAYMKAFCAYICGIGEKNGIGFGTVEPAQ